MAPVTVHGYTDRGVRQRRTASKFTFRVMARIVVQASQLLPGLLDHISVNGYLYPWLGSW